MRIVYFHQYFATRDSATGTRSFELAKRLAARGHEVTIVSSAALLPRDQGAGAARVRPFVRDRVEGIDLLLLNVPYSNYFSYAERLAAFALFTAEAGIAGPLLPRPDVVFASSTPLTIGIPGLLTARLRRTPFVFELRDLWPEVPIAIGALRSPPLIAAARRLEALLYAGAARIVVLSEASRDALLARGVPAGKLVFVPNACDLDLFRPTTSTTEFRARHGLTASSSRSTPARWAAPTASTSSSTPRPRCAPPGATTWPSSPSATAAAGRTSKTASASSGSTTCSSCRRCPSSALAGVVGAADVTLTLFAPDPVFETNSPNKFFDSLAAGRPVVINLDGWLRRVVADATRRPLRAGRRRRRSPPPWPPWPTSPPWWRRMARERAPLAEREFDRDVHGRPALRGARRGRPGQAAGTPDEPGPPSGREARP